VFYDSYPGLSVEFVVLNYAKAECVAARRSAALQRAWARRVSALRKSCFRCRLCRHRAPTLARSSLKMRCILSA